MKCTFCNKQSAYVRPYDNLALCITHFNEQFEKKVQKTINEYNLFKRRDKIAIGVSGGKDSVVLLYVLYKLEQRYPQSQLVVITIDEGIEGYRDEGLFYAKKHVNELDLEHHIVSFEEGFGYSLDDIIGTLGDRKPGQRTYGACTYCGILRRKLLNKTAMEIGATVLATGHNLEDEAETVLLNIIRGDIKRLARQNPEPKKIHHSLVPRAKPFRLTPQAEIVMYSILNDLSYQEMPCPYSVEAYRGEVRDFVFKTQHDHPMISFNIVRGHDKLLPFIKNMKTKKKLKDCTICGEATTGTLCRSCSLEKLLDSRK